MSCPSQQSIASAFMGARCARTRARALVLRPNQWRRVRVARLRRRHRRRRRLIILAPHLRIWRICFAANYYSYYSELPLHTRHCRIQSNYHSLYGPVQRQAAQTDRQSDNRHSVSLMTSCLALRICELGFCVCVRACVFGLLESIDLRRRRMTLPRKRTNKRNRNVIDAVVCSGSPSPSFMRAQSFIHSV